MPTLIRLFFANSVRVRDVLSLFDHLLLPTCFFHNTIQYNTAERHLHNNVLSLISSQFKMALLIHPYIFKATMTSTRLLLRQKGSTRFKFDPLSSVYAIIIQKSATLPTNVNTAQQMPEILLPCNSFTEFNRKKNKTACCEFSKTDINIFN